MRAPQPGRGRALRRLLVLRWLFLTLALVAWGRWARTPSPWRALAAFGLSAAWLGLSRWKAVSMDRPRPLPGPEGEAL